MFMVVIERARDEETNDEQEKGRECKENNNPPLRCFHAHHSTTSSLALSLLYLTQHVHTQTHKRTTHNMHVHAP
jgi:hypothetical protein